jgi:hypothetical protein
VKRARIKKRWKDSINPLRGKTSKRAKTRLMALRVARWLDYSGGKTDKADILTGLKINPKQFEEAVRELRKDKAIRQDGNDLTLLRSSRIR